jgi:hypothetical protein
MSKFIEGISGHIFHSCICANVEYILWTWANIQGFRHVKNYDICNSDLLKLSQ